MRKIIFSMNISLDGFFEGPHHELDWSIADAELHDFFADLLNSADIILYGRVTYQLMKDYWPKAHSDPNATPSELRFADAINPLNKIVYSSTLKTEDWNTQVVEKFNPEDIVKMKTQPGGNILVGGGAVIAQAFLRNGLVDEIQLAIHPVAIGNGTPLFSGIEGGIKLDYQWYRTFKSGVVVLCYQPDGMVLSPNR